MKSTIVIAALVVSALGVSTIVPTFAQDAPAPPAPPAVAPATPPATTTPDTTTPKPMHRFARKGGGMGGMNRGGDRLIALACSNKGAEVLQRVLDRTGKRLNLTADQQKLFDTFRDKALTTETSFADTCKTAIPDRTAGAKPDLITGLKARLAIDEARLTAMNAVLPDFEALYTSLTDTQKQALLPRWDHQGDQHGGPGRMGRPPMPGRG